MDTETAVRLENHEQQIKSLKHRMDEQEEQNKTIQELAISVKELAMNMEAMLHEQGEQGKRLTGLENRDGEMWRKVVTYCITCIIGLAIGYIFRSAGI